MLHVKDERLDAVDDLAELRELQNRRAHAPTPSPPLPCTPSRSPTVSCRSRFDFCRFPLSIFRPIRQKVFARNFIEAVAVVMISVPGVGVSAESMETLQNGTHVQSYKHAFPRDRHLLPIFAPVCSFFMEVLFSQEAQISRAVRCGPRLCTRKRWAIGIVSVGLMLFTLGMFALLYIPIALREGVTSNMIISSADAPLYDKFAHGGADPAPVIDNFYFYNCTNFEAVLEGQPPLLQVVGPYAFRRFTDRVQSQWSDSEQGQVVEYVEWKHWDVVPDGTPTRDPNETIVNFNPGYFGAVASAGGELKLSIAMISAVILDIFHGLSHAAIPATRFAFAIMQMSEQVKTILLDPRINGNSTLFQELWASSTSPPWNFTSDWNMLLPGQQTGQPLHVSQQSVSLLWDANLLGSIANPSVDSVLELLHASSSPDSLSKWAKTFAIDLDTASIILLRWLPQYMCGKSDPLLCDATGASSDCGCSQDPNPVCGYVAAEWNLPCNTGIGALTWQQFVQGTVSMEVWKEPSMISVFPSVFPGSSTDAPELFSYMQSRLPKFFVPTDIVVLWMTGDCGIANASNILEWAEATINPVILQRCYNMSLSMAADLDFYMVALRDFASHAYAQSMFARNGGVKRQQSAFDWLFNTVDPLVHRLSPSQANINFMHNLTWENTRRAALVDTMYTGKDNINRIMQYKSWRNQSVINYGVHNAGGSMTIDSAYVGIGFQPWQVPDLLPVYEEDLFRVVHLQALPDSSKQFTFEGIKMHLYTVSSADFSTHLKVANYREGFLNGSLYEGAPIFWSRLFFFNTPAENNINWSSRVVVMNAPDNLEGEFCETRIGVEPFTGQIMFARKRMQTNLYVSAAKEDPSAFNFYNKKVYRGPSPTDGYMMPLFYLDESGQISPGDAQIFKSQVYGTQTVGLIIGITNVCVGGAMMLIGIVMYWLDRQSNSHRILIEESELGDETPVTHASTSSLFAAISDRKTHGLQAPPGSPRASD